MAMRNRSYSLFRICCIYCSEVYAYETDHEGCSRSCLILNFVYWEKEQKKIPSELFLVGALAGSIDSSCETEALKAQAVMLRSSLYRKMQQEDTKLAELTTADSSYLSVAEQKNKWGDSYEETEKKLLEAVSQTKGVVAVYEGMPVMGCYHGMSAGMTRDGAELSDAYGYLKQADCSKNLSAASYIRTTKRTGRGVGQKGSTGLCDRAFAEWGKDKR